jgi:hypothetical protein
MGISLGFISICIFLSITFIIIYIIFTKKNNEKFGNSVYIKNIVTVHRENGIISD